MARAKKGYSPLTASGLAKVRAWQRKARLRREPLTALALQLRVSPHSLRGLLRRRALARTQRVLQTKERVRMLPGAPLRFFAAGA